MPITLDAIFWRRLGRSAREALAPAGRTVGWLLSLIVPVSLLVTLLDYVGVLPRVAGWVQPLMRLLGLPGEAALVVLTAASLNIYSAIAVMQTLTLTVRQATILALICLIAHNLPVETAVQQRAGTSGAGMLGLRLLAALAGGMLLNLTMPQASPLLTPLAAALPAVSGLADVLLAWAGGVLWLALKITLIVAGLMILQRWLAEFGWLHRLARWLRPVLAVLGLPRSTAFLWLVANCMGLAFGAAVMLEHVRAGDISRADLRLFHCHAAISHSLLEDTLLFVAVGVSAAWIIWPRLLLAAAAVWLCRAWLRYRPAGNEAA